MKITRTSLLSGEERTIEMPTVTPERLEEWRPSDGKTPGKPIQEVFPELTADDREFILTGITSDEWDEEFLRPDLKKPTKAKTVSDYHKNIRQQRLRR